MSGPTHLQDHLVHGGPDLGGREISGVGQEGEYDLPAVVAHEVAGKGVHMADGTGLGEEAPAKGEEAAREGRIRKPRLGLRGPVFAVSSACSTANHSIAAAADQIALGRADVMLAGGTEAPLVWGVLKGWEALRVLAKETCRPFSADRDGLVIGEGAGVVVLERLEHALARGATILAEYAGAGLSADATDIVAPTVEGPTAAMANCLADAGLKPEEVDYVNAHGTGTRMNDQIETQAIRRAFGDAADRLSVSSTKSMHGHCLGATAAIEMIACVRAVTDGVVPPTANYRAPDPACDLDVTPNAARRREVRAAISNAFAFGGTNATVAVKAYRP